MLRRQRRSRRKRNGSDNSVALAGQRDVTGVQGGSTELHAPTSSTQKLKLIGKCGQFTYTPTLPLTCRLPQAAYVEYWSGL
jgi:hypothetical protein